MALTSPMPIEFAVSDEGEPTDEKFGHFVKDGMFCIDQATGRLYVRVGGVWRKLAYAG